MSPRARQPNFSPAQYRLALGMFATGVAVITGRNSAGALFGLTVNSFNSVSLEPPLVLWSLSRAAAPLRAFSAGSHYAINILSAQQQALAQQFAAKNVDRFANVAHSQGLSGAPLLTGAVAIFECFNRSRYEEGDHVIFVGQVESCSHQAGVAPLLFHAGKFYSQHPL